MWLWRLVVAGSILALMIAPVFPRTALAQSGTPADALVLSPYWQYAVSRWEPIIAYYAERRGLDPNLVAAVIWKESLGRPKARSPVGAVGLMMLMPFPWRPSPEELENPWVNVAWGTRALAQTIRDGHGDVYYALAAYNGSWEKADQQNTRRYAASVLDIYARAIAIQNGLPQDGDWVAIIAVEGLPGPGTLTVFGPQRPLARYTERLFQADVPALPVDVPPHAVVLTFVDERGAQCRVSLWLVAADGSPLWRPSEEAVSSTQVVVPGG